MLAFTHRLELSLDMEDRPLPRFADRRAESARKAAAEKNSCRFRKNCHVAAEAVANQLEERGLAGARAAGQDHYSLGMWAFTIAGMHGLFPRIPAPQSGAE